MQRTLVNPAVAMDIVIGQREYFFILSSPKMSKYDPLNLMGNPNDPNRWLHMVPKVHRFQCEICRCPAPSYRAFKEHTFILHAVVTFI